MKGVGWVKGLTGFLTALVFAVGLIIKLILPQSH